jgi:hypothetical protein
MVIPAVVSAVIGVAAQMGAVGGTSVVVELFIDVCVDRLLVFEFTALIFQ